VKLEELAFERVKPNFKKVNVLTEVELKILERRSKLRRRMTSKANGCENTHYRVGIFEIIYRSVG